MTLTFSLLVMVAYLFVIFWLRVRPSALVGFTALWIGGVLASYWLMTRMCD